MANLAQNAPASLIGIVHPMVGGNITRIHPVVDSQRFVNRRQKLFHLQRHRSEAAIEADHQQGSVFLGRRADKGGQFAFIQAKRLFAEDGLPRAQGRKRLAGMKIVAGRDQHRVDFRIAQKVGL